MIVEELVYRIGQTLGHVPTAEQRQAMNVIAQFMFDRSPRAVMILRGSAGTGKTTLAAAVVRALLLLKQKLVLMAPTGRAAKVFALYAGQPAHTIHRRIYRQRSAADLSAFTLNANLSHDTLFMVDEASMVSLSSPLADSSIFGSGCLLDDLVSFVYQGEGCRLMLIGDHAQLPPVGEEESPALMSSVLSGYGLKVYECTLSEVLRQSQQSGILWNATRIRESMSTMPDGSGLGTDMSSMHGVSGLMVLPKIRFRGFADIVVVPGDELIESLSTSYSRVGVDETIVVTRSNKRANVYNQGIRRTVLDREDELSRGDQLMIVKNNYSLSTTPSQTVEGISYQTNHDGEMGTTAHEVSASSSHDGNTTGRRDGGTVENVPSFLANGDRCVLQRVRHVRELYGFRFADVTLTMPDYDDYELTMTAILDTLSSEAPALTRDQHEQLYNQVLADYADLPYKADRMKALKTDRYYNALQVKYGYAVTCHKAQGGQWAHVYIDQGYMTDDMLTPDYLHWLYTALTRATEKVFLVNWPPSQTDND